MSDLVIADKSEIVSIADSVRQLTGTTNTMTLSQMKSNLNTTKTSIDNAFTALSDKGVDISGISNPGALAELITSIKQGGGGTIGAASAKDVNFYDYDGTLLYAYTLDEAHALTALPDGPAHAGLVFDGWNWALEKVQSLTRPMNIGAMYSTDDGTTRIYIRLEDGRTSPMLGICPKGTVTVDWGDGTDPDVLTGTSLTTVKWTPTHNYAAPGDYVIRLTVDGSAQLYGETYNLKRSCILRYSTGADYRNKIYQSAIRKVEVGNGVVYIGESAFEECYSLSSITIPAGVTSLGDNVFYNCYGIKYYDFTRHTAVPSLSNTNAFTGIADDCEIRVPAALADEWKAATNWATYADYIVGV